MLRNMRWYALVLVLAVSIIFAGGLTSKAEGSRLMDLGEASWAQQAITEMEASGVVAGYPGNVYKPYNNVTKLEAVTMLIRMLGLEDQAVAAEEAGSDYLMPADLYWGEGYLIMAVQRGMLDGDYLYLLEPNSPATRTEVAMLAFHALKLEPDSSTMKFDDADQIPGEYRDGIAAVVKSGIMQGLPGNVFKPNDEINRAQIAVLMSNIVELKYADPCPDRRENGTVSGIDLDSRVITLKSVGSIFYAADCEFFLDDTSVAPGELKLGDEVNIILDENQHAVYINFQRYSDGKIYKGTVSSVLMINGQYWLGVSYDDGQEITRTVADGVKVSKSGSRVEVSTLNKGEYIEIQVLDNKITVINFIASYSVLSGVIKELDTTGTLGITIRDDEGETVKYVVNGDVEVERDGRDIDFDDLEAGEQIRLELNSKGFVSYIKVIKSNTKQVEGKIRDLDITGTLGITIRDYEGEIEKYVVVDDVEVERDGRDIDFDDLDEGEWVSLSLNSRDRVVSIEVIEEYSVVEGTISDLITDRSPKMIRIIKSNGTRGQYDIARNVDYSRDGVSISLDDIVIGSEVDVWVNEDDKVISIKVTNDKDITIEGTVIYVSESDNKIKIEQASGNRFTYNFARSPILKDSYGYSIDLEDIEDDAEVTIVLKSGKISSLKVQ